MTSSRYGPGWDREGLVKVFFSFPFILLLLHWSGCDRRRGGRGTHWYMVHTPRTRNSMNLFEAESPRRIEIAADQEDVSSVVVLKHTQVSPR